MRAKKYNKISDLTEDLELPSERGVIAEMKAEMTKEIIKAIEKQGLTHLDVAEISGVPRSAITGIVSGSLQKVTLDRLVRILSAVGKRIELKIKNAA